MAAGRAVRTRSCHRGKDTQKNLFSEVSDCGIAPFFMKSFAARPALYRKYGTRHAVRGVGEDVGRVRSPHNRPVGVAAGGIRNLRVPQTT